MAHITSDIKVLKANTVWHQDPHQGEKGSDKVYSVQLIQDGLGQYHVESQYGKRGSNLRSAPTTYTGANQWTAERAFNELLQGKVHGKKGDAYDRVINPAIIPTEFGGAGYSRSITKADELKTSKQVDVLHNFLGNIDEVEIVAPPVKSAKSQADGLSALMEAFGSN